MSDSRETARAAPEATGLEGLVAEALPRFDVGPELGRGAWGIVLSATHRHLGRAVAIKVVAPGLGEDPAMQARFLAEAQLLASLDHPHVVQIFDFVEHRDFCLLVMEHLTGPTLWSRLTGPGLRLRASCAAVMATCSAIHHAHERHVLHRDVKPVNVLISDQRVVKVIDFGLAKVIGGTNSYVTRTGEVVGTPAYMAPEQAEEGELTPRTDVYSTGIMFYEFLSGQLPFSEEGGALPIMYRHVHEAPAPLSITSPALPGPLAEVAMTAIARAPQDRFPSAEAFGVAIGEAAGTVWGPGWDGDAEFSIFAPGPIHATLSAKPSAYDRTGQADAAVSANRADRPSLGPVRAMVSQHVDGRIARALHEVYVAWNAEHFPADSQSTLAWVDLDDALKASNQAHADHIFVKLQALGCTVHPVYDRNIVPFPFTDAELEDMAEMEHRRWHAERLANGWTPGATKDVARKVSPYLVGWDELSEHVKGYDREMVRAIPEILASVGLEIRR